MIDLIIDLIPILISLFISIILYKRLNPPWLRAFTWFLIFCIIISSTGYAYSFYLKKNNHFIFNIYLLVQYLFYFGIFYKTFQAKKLKKLTILVSCGFTIYLLFDFFFADGFYTFNSSAYTLGSVLTILFCLIYFGTLFKSDGFINYFRIPMFWIATGILFFFVGNFIYLSFINYILINNLDKEGNIYRFIMGTLNLLLYCLFSIGFLSNQTWKKKT
ncbi:MAG: hypothetical protein M3Z26_02205 [Bacteroidota bacterium]|nr:hypothetical protein [Bacteroidota bacterium]